MASSTDSSDNESVSSNGQENLMKKLCDLDIVFSKLSSSIKNLKEPTPKKLRDTKKAVDEIKKGLRDAQAQLLHLVVKTTKEKEEKEKLTKKVKELQEELSRKDEIISRLEQEVEKLKTNVKETQTQLKAASREITSNRAQIEAHNEQISKLKETFQDGLKLLQDEMRQSMTNNSTKASMETSDGAPLQQPANDKTKTSEMKPAPAAPSKPVEESFRSSTPTRKPPFSRESPEHPSLGRAKHIPVKFFPVTPVQRVKYPAVEYMLDSQGRLVPKNK